MSLSIDNLGSLVQKGFARAAINTSARLQDDELVRAAARNIYDVIPFPANLAIKMSVGIEGLERFALSFRDVLLASGVTDLSRISAEDLRVILRKSMARVPGLGKLVGGIEAGTAAGPRQLAAAPHTPKANPISKFTSDIAGTNAAEATPSATPKSWYLLRQSTRYGPWTDAEFLSLAEEGRLDRTDMVWRDGFPGWIGLSDMPKLTGRS